MNGRSRRRIEMGTRALEFSRAHPDTEPGTATAAARLEQLLARATEMATVQRDGLIHVRAAAARKEELRRQMRDVPIAHLAEVGRAAAREEHELGKTFTFKPGASTFLAFRTAARSMASSAQTHRELLVKYGLSQSVLDEFVQMLDQFDEAVALGNDGRTAHVGATRDLRVVATEIVPDGAGDGRPEPAAVCRSGAAVGVLDQREHGAGTVAAGYGAGGRDAGGRRGEAGRMTGAKSVSQVSV